MGTNIGPALGATAGKPSSALSAPKKRRGTGWIWVLFIGLSGLAGYRYYPQVTQGASRGEKGGEKTVAKRPGQVVPVLAAVSRRGDLSIFLTGLGSVTAYNTVTIRSRVDGELINVAFTEGQLVHQGDLLAEIDPRPFQAQLNQLEGQLARDTAMSENARLDAKRYEQLAAQGVISRQQLDTQNATVHQYDGTISADQGRSTTRSCNCVLPDPVAADAVGSGCGWSTRATSSTPATERTGDDHPVAADRGVYSTSPRTTCRR